MRFGGSKHDLLVCETESFVVREIGKLKAFVGSADTIPGLTHITLFGAVQDGMKEVRESHVLQGTAEASFDQHI